MRAAKPPRTPTTTAIPILSPHPASGPVRRLAEIAENRPLLLRFLPWPDGFMLIERDNIRKAIVTMDQLVRDWVTMPDTLAKATERLNSQPYYPVRAPKLFERALLIIGAAGLPVDVAELAARRAEAAALPSALDVVDAMDLLDGYLTRLEGETGSRPPQDAETLARARQYQREAAARLLEMPDATRVPSELGTIVDRASRLASRLPRPGALPRDIEQLRTESVGGAEVLQAPLAAFRRVREILQAANLAAGHTTLIVLTLAVGVWSGLAVLYIGKSWGGSYADYLAALVWGFGAATVIAPVVSAAKQLGTRPQDATSATDAK